MKTNSSIVAMLLLVLVYVLLRPLSVLFAKWAPSIFDKIHNLDGENYSSFWINIVQLNNLLFSLITLTTMILLVMAFRKWQNLKHYDISIIRKLDLVGYLFIIEGIIILLLNFAIMGKDFTKNTRFKGIYMDIHEGALTILIGLLFLLITSILTNAKFVKDENDLTI